MGTKVEIVLPDVKQYARVLYVICTSLCTKDIALAEIELALQHFQKVGETLARNKGETD